MLLFLVLREELLIMVQMWNGFRDCEMVGLGLDNREESKTKPKQPMTKNAGFHFEGRHHTDWIIP